jgi:hypothetical protein
VTTYKIKAPDGNSYSIDGPEGASDDQVREQVMKQHPGADKAAEPSSVMDALKEGGKGLIRGAESFAGQMGEAVMGPFGPTHHLANLKADLGFGDKPAPEPGYGEQLAHATGVEPAAKTTAGKFAGATGEVLGNPATYMGAGSAALKVGAGAASALASEGAGQLAESAGAGPGVAGAARVVGGIAGGTAAVGAGNVVRNAASPRTNVAADFARAMERDGLTPEVLSQRLQEARAVRPNATVADVGGENIRGLVERVAQTPGAGRTTIKPALTERQQQQLQRVSGDLEGLTGARQTAVRATQETMASRAETATPLYQQAYADGDRAVWSPELERLSSSPTVRNAMHGAVSIWQDNAIADGYGSMNPGAMVDRGGQLSFPGGQLPAFPNLQFWDYTKRVIDDQVGAAVRAGENAKARTLTTLVGMMRQELDAQVPTYAAARQAWGGPSQYISAIEDGGNILQRTLSGEQLRANLAEMTEAQREGYLIGAVSSIAQRMRSDPAKLADMTKYLRSPEMRDKITALMPTPEAAQSWLQRLDYEVGSSELTGKALGGSATYRRAAERQDADSIMGDLVMGAFSHGPTGLLRQALMALPNRIRDSLRSRSDALLADILVNPRADVGPALQGAPAPSAGPTAARSALAQSSALSQPQQ